MPSLFAAAMTATQTDLFGKHFQPSTYQQRIFDWVESGRGDAIVIAVAGSGKTTTLIEVCKRLPNPADCQFLAFNKSVADELGRRLPTGVTASTLHSLGMRACGRVKLDNLKYRRILEDWLDPRRDTAAIAVITELISKAQTQAISYDPTPDDLYAVARRFRLDLGRDAAGIAKLAIAAIREGVRRYQESGVINYSDMIWLPVALDLPVPGAGFTMVDECQDLSPTQLALAMKARGTGRALWVGDPSQSIYYFNGAASDSVQQIQAATGAVELPLSLTYRCPKSVVTLAQKFDPRIEPLPDAPMGSVDLIGGSRAMVDAIAPGDLVVCRKTAPLVKACIAAIAARKPAKVLGKDIAKNLVSTMEKIERRCVSIRQFRSEVREWLDRKSEPTETEQDTAATLIALWEAVEPENFERFRAEILGIFTDGVPKIRFATIHKAKGLEADRVFILGWQDMPLRWKNISPEESRQEANLQYVAVTRAKNELYLC